MSVLPDVAGLPKLFDYLAPPGVAVGSLVRVRLAGRRVGGWVVGEVDDPDPERALLPLSHVRGWGPPPELVELSTWAAWRWAGRRSALLASASPPVAVTGLPAAALRPPAPPARSWDLGPGEGVTVLRLPPGADPTGAVAAIAQRGPTLVVVPSVSGAAVLADRLRRAGGDVAAVPDQWAAARAGAAVVVGPRAAAWAPCPGLAAAVVLDAHDQALVQEQAPAWWATTVVAERARRAGAPCWWVSACPTLDLLAAADRVIDAPGPRWAPLEVVDRTGDDPRLGLWSDPLVRLVRSGARVRCVLNRTGRARLLSCRACGQIARCERCGGAVSQLGPAGSAAALACARCGLERPVVCAVCGSTALRALRVGVTRAREELAALTGGPVAEVTAAGWDGPGDAPVAVGTEAVLHRPGPVDAVAFVDFDQELVAPRLRAAEEALALLARASRLVAAARGRVLVQTRLPDHPVLDAARHADPARLAEAEAPIRAALSLPPAAALALLSGPGAAALAAAVSSPQAGAGGAGAVTAAPAGEDRWLLRAGSVGELCDALAAAERPAGRVRVEVDPVRF